MYVYLYVGALLTVVGASEYVKKEIGDGLNIIISVPHGGIKRSGFPDREDGCLNEDGDCVYTNCAVGNSAKCKIRNRADSRTITLARRLRDDIKKQTGKTASYIECLLHRSKLDANRDIDEGAQGYEQTEDVYNEYHDAIKEAYDSIEGTKGLLVDIHGQAKESFTMLGYLISKNSLNGAVGTLNRKANDSSIRYLAARTPRKTFNDLLRGSQSLGAMLYQEGISSVPSPNKPSPGNDFYYSGGVTVRKYAQFGKVDAIQIEVNWLNRKSLTAARNYGSKLAKAIVAFYNKYYG